jgi:multicomponent Na+:H+ antiporter subunit E
MRSAHPLDLVLGAVSALGATWASLRLLPPDAGRVRLLALCARMPRFLWQSVMAGIDVARRAFAPRLPLRPGVVDVPAGFPQGLARNAFTTICSLLPGSVPVGDDAESLNVHCLDVDQPVAEQFAAEERAYRRALVPPAEHG